MDTSKIIKGVVGGGRYTVTAPIVKEDYGLYLKLEGLELPATYEVDFSNDEHNGTSVTMIGNADGVLIPSQFIKSGKDVFAFLYHVGEDYGRTIFKFRIPNKLRPDRTDEQPTPEEQSVIDQTISALNNAVEQTSQDVISAYESAQNASVSADRAERSESASQLWAETAENYSDSAEQSASQANAAATASAQSAQSAETARQETTFLVAEAQRYADASEQSATNAQTYALSANAASGTAENFADVASRLASQAQVSANTASEKASEASGYASTASTKASEASASAVSASGYATQAESAKTASQIAQGLAEEARDDSEQIKSDVQDLADGIDTRLVDVEDGILKAFPTDTASGAVASFTDGADGLPLKSLVVDINPIQDTSSGDPSPENICPISGWTEVDVEQRGKNLWKFDASYSPTGYSVLVNKQPLYLPVGTYTFSAIPNILSDSIVLFGYHADGTRTEIARLLSSTSRQSGSCTIAKPVVSAYFVSNKGGTISDIQLEVGSTATDYEPYSDDTYDITFPAGAGTVYGGKLDVLSGELVVDRAMAKISDLTWIFIQNYTYMNTESLKTEIAKPASATTILDGLMCSAYKSGTAQQAGSGNVNGIIAVDTYGYLRINDNSYTDADEWKTAMGSQTIVYPLATPITYTLTPTEVRSLLGQNNIFADTGDSAVEYRADPDLYIQRKMPEVPVDDVQINGQSIVTDGVANVPAGSTTRVGVFKIDPNKGISVYNYDQTCLICATATLSEIKAATNGYKPLAVQQLSHGTFYGLAKAAGDTTQSQSSNAVGSYTEDAKSAISEMLGGSVSVSGTTPTIVAKSGIRYVCGEVSTLDITVPASGIIDVIFTSGSTATVLTVTPPTGMTMKWANGFDPTALEANTTYEINIMDGCLGVVGTWT